jgi:hypothetical protein
MKRFVVTSVLVLLAIFFAAGSAFATTYYVAANGSDANSGTSKTTPWLHAPGMPGCSGTCASTTPTAGDSFILRGGDIWTVSGQWTWSWSGTSGSPISIGGLDQTWYSGSSWTRPILNGGGTWPSSGTANLFFFSLNDVSYVTEAWIEMKGYYIGSSATNYTGYINRGSSGNNINIHDNYIHGWSHAAGIGEGSPGGIVDAILCNTGGTDATTNIYNNVIDGSDTAENDFSGIYATGGCGNVYQNYISWIPDAVNEDFIVSFHDNVLADDGAECFSGCGSHNNVMEENQGPSSGNSFFYNNLFVNPAPSDENGGIVTQLAPHAGQTSWFFNNVISNGPPYVTGTFQNNEVVCADTFTGASGGACTIFNNTIEGGLDTNPPNAKPVRAGSFNGSTSPTAINLYNNHTISSSSPMYTTSDCNSGCAVTQSPNPNLIQSVSVANGQGYALSQTYSFSPTSGSGATVGSGTNETSLCTTIASLNAAAGTACQRDTTYGISYNTTTHTVTFPARTTNARPASGAWDEGAYEWNSSSGAQPNPPTGLTAVVE